MGSVRSYGVKFLTVSRLSSTYAGKVCFFTWPTYDNRIFDPKSRE